jgi:hypothetical protein
MVGWKVAKVLELRGGISVRSKMFENEKNKKKKSFNAILISVFTDKMVGLKTVIEHKLDNCPYFVT